MTTVILDVLATTADGPRPAHGPIEWQPTRHHTALAGVVLPVPHRVTLPRKQIVLEATDLTWCYRVSEPGARVPRYLAVPESAEPVLYSTLVEVDPATLEPTAEPEAAWWSEVGQQIDAGEVVDGRLVLTHRDGTQTDAGEVRGPAGVADDTSVQTLIDDPESATRASLLGTIATEVGGVVAPGTVHYGNIAGTPRPSTTAPVVWVGNTGVYPVNALDNDLIFTSDPHFGPVPIPGGYLDTFDNEPGQAPSGWTEYWRTDTATATEHTDGYLLIDRTSASRWGFGLDDLGPVSGDVDLVMKCRYEDGGTGTFLHGLLIGGSGATTAENGVSAYLNITSGIELRLGRFAAGTWADSTAVTVSPTRLPGQWVWLRLNVTDSTARARFWLDGDAEPTTWTATTTLAATPDPGWAGIFGGSARLFKVDRLAVVTGAGNTAPTGA